MIGNIWIWKHWKVQIPGKGLWEWHVLMACVLAGHQDAGSFMYIFSGQPAPRQQKIDWKKGDPKKKAVYKQTKAKTQCIYRWWWEDSGQSRSHETHTSRQKAVNKSWWFTQVEQDREEKSHCPLLKGTNRPTQYWQGFPSSEAARRRDEDSTASIPCLPSNRKKAWTDHLGTMWCLCAEQMTWAHISCGLWICGTRVWLSKTDLVWK